MEYSYSLTNWQRLKDLIDGTSSSYLPTAGTGTFDFGARQITGVTAPGTSSYDVVNKGYADAYIGGKATDLTTVGAGFGGGQTLVWDQALAKWVTGSASDATKLPLAGGTMSGDITMAGNDLFSVGDIIMNTQKRLQLGRYTASEESTLTATLGTANAGVTWFNSTTGMLTVWNGTSATSAGAGGTGGTLSWPLEANPSTTTANAPSYSFSGDTDTGLYSPGSGTITLATNGTARFTVDDKGAVGVGTTSPQAALDVSATGPAVSAVIVPRDTTANRPSAPVNGMIRYNTDLNSFEGYINGAWTLLNSGIGSTSMAFVTLTDAATVDWTVSGLQNNATVTLGGNRTLSFTGLANGMSGTLIIKQDATGSRTLTLPSQCANKVVSGGGAAVSLSTAANAIDIITFTYDGTNCYWTYGKNYD